MLSKYTETQPHDIIRKPAVRATISLQVVLWAVWTLFVVGVTYLRWQEDVVVGQPANIIAIVLRALLAGVVGLIAMTMIEMQVEPERYGA